MKLTCNQCGSEILGDSLEGDATVTVCPNCGCDLLFNADAGRGTAKTVVQLGRVGPGTIQSAETGFVISDEFAAPTRLGRYRILRPLGSGGFALVYLARDEELYRQVAIKIPRRDRFVSEADYERFFEEARVLARFEHPGIVPVYDVGVDGDVRFIVTRYIDGTSLSNRLHLSPVSFSETARIIAQCASAIHAAHKRQIYHRDLKPGNILLTKEGEALVADFGLAISREQMQPYLREVSGTPRYMSPEQVKGDVFRLDGRSDIWSLGVILYRMLTDTEPFLGEGRHLAQEIQEKEPVPLRQHNELIPAELEQICLKCLKKHPEDRYQTAHDLAKHLDDWHRSTSASTLSAQPTPISPFVSGDTSEGMSGPTLPFVQKQSKLSRAIWLGSTAIGGMIALIAFCLMSGGLRVKVDSGGDKLPDVKKELTSARREAHPVPGKWYPLLSSLPRKLIFPRTGPSRLFYDATTEETTLHTPEAGYASFLETRSESYRYSVRIHRSNWIGEAGLFFGYRPLECLDGSVKHQCLAVYLTGYKTPKGESQYRIRLDQLVVTPRVRLHEDVSPGNLLSAEVRSPDGNDHFIEITIRSGTLNQILWDGQSMFDAKSLARSQWEIKQPWLKELGKVTGEGQLGIFSIGGDTVFSDARLMLIP